MASEKPYVVKKFGDEWSRYATFEEALRAYRGSMGAVPLAHEVWSIENENGVDAEFVDGRWKMYDGLTDEEREQL